MFEGKPPFPPEMRVWKSGQPAGDSLCALSWDELKAKLSAARDLRSELAKDTADDGASFDADSARRLAAQHDRLDDLLGEAAPVKNGKGGINPDDLANGKGACPTVGQRGASGDPANRGNT